MELVLKHCSDLRQRKTHRAINAAFFALLAHGAFDDITVLQLVNEAEIGQTTFYRHYADKFELAQEAINLHLNALSELFFTQLCDAHEDPPTDLDPSEFAQLISRIRALHQIQTPEVSFEREAKACISETIQTVMHRHDLHFTYPQATTAHLAALFYSFLGGLLEETPAESAVASATTQLRELTQVLRVLLTKARH
ncbi:TetR/AcrR family transcriptional regulator [Lacticaseibacillus jixiensis]|uniref:TetR/AcrR family transcriptional regulator n=1 Tax=Lacticaseibacillus jixiensis TaxID=3231926 RepID=UPI0036F356DB